MSLHDADHTHPFHITIHCRRCRSKDVLRDAWAAWNEETQRWERSAVFDDAYCVDCDGETRLVERRAVDGAPVSKHDLFDGEAAGASGVVS